MNVKINNIIKIHMTKKKLNKKSCKKRLNKISYKKKHYGGANSSPIQEDLKTSIQKVLEIENITDIIMCTENAEFKLQTIDCILSFSKSELVLSYNSNTEIKHDIIKTINDLQTKLIYLYTQGIKFIFYYLSQEQENYNDLKIRTETSKKLLYTENEYILRYNITTECINIIYKTSTEIKEEKITLKERPTYKEKINEKLLSHPNLKYSLKLISIYDFLKKVTIVSPSLIVKKFPTVTPEEDFFKKINKISPDFMVQLEAEAELSKYFTKATRGLMSKEKESIGKGSYGEVFDIKLGKTLGKTLGGHGKKNYVVKEFLDGDEESIQNEIIILSKIRAIELYRDFSPEILKCIYLKGSNKYYVIMEKLILTLEDYKTNISVDSSGYKSPDKKLFTECLIPLLTLFNTLHMYGIVHRDIKPENIMVTKDKKFKIIDFGESYINGDKIILYKKGVGTPAYINSIYYSKYQRYYKDKPQKIFGDILKTDEYSLSIVLYETLVASFNPTIFPYRKTFNFSFYLNLIKISDEQKYIDLYKRYQEEFKFKDEEINHLNHLKFNYNNLQNMIKDFHNDSLLKFNFIMKKKYKDYFNSHEFKILEKFITTNLNPDTPFENRISIEQILLHFEILKKLRINVTDLNVDITAEVSEKILIRINNSKVTNYSILRFTSKHNELASTFTAEDETVKKYSLKNLKMFKNRLNPLHYTSLKSLPNPKYIIYINKNTFTEEEFTSPNFFVIINTPDAQKLFPEAEELKEKCFILKLCNIDSVLKNCICYYNGSNFEKHPISNLDDLKSKLEENKNLTIQIKIIGISPMFQDTPLSGGFKKKTKRKNIKRKNKKITKRKT